jgi:hypothetical protein
MGVRGRDIFHTRSGFEAVRVMYGDRRMEAGVLTAGNPADLSFLDVACSMPLGANGERPRVPQPASLDDACTRAFSHSFGRGPCYLPFSGGRESTMWLATATRSARRNGHDDPVPITLRYPGLATAEELRVQERVVAHLGLADWERIELEESLDLIGPVARDTLTRTGPIWPPHAYMMAPLIEAARDGVFVFMTGLGDLFSWWRWGPLAGVLERHRRPGTRDLALLGAALMPASLRARAARRHGVPPAMPWLRPAAERDALARLRRRHAEVPLRFDRAVATQVTHRCFDGAAGTFAALGEAFGTDVEQPLRRAGVAESFAGAGGPRGFRSLGEMLRRMSGELVPADVLTPRPTPDLTRLFFDDASKEFAANWTGAGLDESVVDVVALRQIWLSDKPDPRTACLLQYAWLTEQASGTGTLPTDDALLVTVHNREAP